MPWKKTDSIHHIQLNRRGLGQAVAAGLVCQEAERLYPQLFRAVSVRNNVIHLEVLLENRLALQMIQGDLLTQLASYTDLKKLPSVKRIRLTVLRKSDIV